MKKSKKKVKLIKFRPELFWDVDVKKLDPDKYPVYIMERILDLGDDKEIRWMWHYYNHLKLKNIVNNSRVISPQVKTLWQLILK